MRCLARLLPLVLLASCTAVRSDSLPSRPNVVVFLVDDLGWQDTSVSFGGPTTVQRAHFHTPALEQLCAGGTRFSQAYSHCVCSPTRVSMMTGANPARHRVTNWTLHRDRPTDAPQKVLKLPEWNVNGISPDPATPRSHHAETLAQRLQGAGYRTIHVGKAHLGARGTPGEDPRILGFDVNVAGHAAGAPASYQGMDGYASKKGDPVWNVPGLDAYHGTPTFLTDALTTEALRAVDEALAAGEPFFLHLSHYAVHTPLQPDARFVERYRAMGLDEKEARYASMVEGMDHSLGRVLQHLDARGIAANTMVVFTSDNGGLSASARGGTPHVHNAPLRSGKGSAYEGGTRVPLAVRWPGHAPAGAMVAQPVIAEDLFASLCEVAGLPSDCPDGRSWLPALSGEPLGERTLLWHYPNHWGSSGPGIGSHSAIRSGDHKLVWFHAEGRFELYDLASDPGEQHDLAAAEPERTAALRKLLSERLTEAAAQVPTRTDGTPLTLP